jgi:hypothetical protein
MKASSMPLENVERLCLVRGLPPVTGWPAASAEQRSPFGPAPLQSLHPCAAAPRRLLESQPTTLPAAEGGI